MLLDVIGIREEEILFLFLSSVWFAQPNKKQIMFR